MFANCIALSDVDIYVPLVTSAAQTFRMCSSLKTLSIDLPLATNAKEICWGCSNLISFSGDLSQVKEGTGLFRDCPNLQHFDSKLTNLCGAFNAFSACILDKESVVSIIRCLKEENTCTGTENISYLLQLYIGINKNLAGDQDLKDLFETSSNLQHGGNYYISNPQGATWTVKVILNTPPAN